MTTKLDQLVLSITKHYKQLKKTQIPQFQRQLIKQIKQQCFLAKKQLDILDRNVQRNRIRKQIQDIQNKMNQVDMKLKLIQTNQQKNHNIKSGRYAYSIKNKMSKEQMLNRVSRAIVIEEIKSSQMKISQKEIDEIAKRMRNNLEIIKQMELMINQQGEDIEQIEKNIQEAYSNVQTANKQLDQAQVIQKHTRLLKIRFAVTGIFSAIGMKILGLPGAILGLITGYGVTK